MNEWLENLYEMCSSNSIENIDVVYDKIDDLLEDKKYSEVNALLVLVDVSRIDTVTTLAFLSDLLYVV